MTTKELMDPHPTTLCPNDTIDKAIRCIMEKRYRNIPVVDEDGCFVGVFGVNCLLRMVLPKAVMMDKGLTHVEFIHETVVDLRQRLKKVINDPISICMSPEQTQIEPDTPLIETLQTLYETKSSIPVVDPETNKLLGMVSYWDVGEYILPVDAK